MSPTRIASLAASLLIAASAPCFADSNWRTGGDVRMGYLAGWIDRRDGESVSIDEGLMRLRLRAASDADQAWQLDTGVAGSFATGQDGFNFYVHRYRPFRTGVKPGDITIDTFNLRYRHGDSGTFLRVGRFVTSFTLPTVAPKSLIRKDASGFNIGWTDGVYLQTPLNDGWQLHLVGQLNSPEGTGNTARAPLDFSASRSRTTLFAALEASQPWGPVSTRVLSLVWMPDALASAGLDKSDRDDYLGVSAQVAASWPVGDSGVRLVAAGELAHAFNTPSREAQQLPGSGSVGGNAWQASLNLFDLQPGHSIGAVFGRVQPGWLVSNDYRENDYLAELRYRWQARPDTVVEIRYRWRREIEQLIDADQRRKSQDAYLRLTNRF